VAEAHVRIEEIILVLLQVLQCCVGWNREEDYTSPGQLLVQALKLLMMILRTERREEEERDIQHGEMEAMEMVRILQVQEEVEATVVEMEVRVGLEDPRVEVVVVEEDPVPVEAIKIKDQDQVALEADITDCTGTADIG